MKKRIEEHGSCSKAHATRNCSFIDLAGQAGTYPLQNISGTALRTLWNHISAQLLLSGRELFKALVQRITTMDLYTLFCADPMGFYQHGARVAPTVAHYARLESMLTWKATVCQADHLPGAPRLLLLQGLRPPGVPRGTPGGRSPCSKSSLGAPGKWSAWQTVAFHVSILSSLA